MSISIEGIDDILESLSKVKDTEKVKQALNKSCLLIEASAKQKAVKGKTGELARSITSKVEGLTGEVYTPLEYAPYVEYGTGLFAENGGRADVPWCYKDDEGKWHSTSGMKPQPYMRPALNENRNKVIEILKEVIEIK